MQAEILLTGDLLLYRRRADNYLLVKRSSGDKRYKTIPKRYDPYALPSATVFVGRKE